MKALARGCAVSVRQLERFFDAHFCQPPKKWLRGLRLCRALEMLCDGCSVKETAITLGYVDTAHLSKDFVSGFGFPPTLSYTLPSPNGEKAEAAIAE